MIFHSCLNYFYLLRFNMFEKQQDYHTFSELVKKLYDKTGKNVILKTLGSINSLIDEKGPRIERNMNGHIGKIFNFASKYKSKKLMKFIVEKYNFFDGHEIDYQELSNIEVSISYYETKYSKDFIDSLILTIVDKYKLIDFFVQDVDAEIKFEFFVKWLLLFHPEKIKNVINDIYKQIDSDILKFVIEGRGFSFVSAKFIPRYEQKSKLIEILFKYLTGKDAEHFYGFMKEYYNKTKNIK